MPTITEPSLTVVSPTGGDKAGQSSKKRKVEETEDDEEDTIAVAQAPKAASKKKGTAVTKKLGRKAPITSAKTSKPTFPNLNAGEDDEGTQVATAVKDEAGDESD